MATSEQEQVETPSGAVYYNESSSSAPVVLILGASGLDRLLTVPCYPQADSKVRTTSHYEVGGGNAANTAHTMALLAKARAFNTSKKQQDNNIEQETAVPSSSSSSSSSSSPLVVVRLCSKVGDDDIGQKIVKELQMAGVDLSCPLFQVAKGTTTGLTTIIVSETEHTRTCMYTPGSCGELTLPEAMQLLQLSSPGSDNDSDIMIMNEFFHNVAHFHADARHTEVALFLARQAQKRGICVSVDVEKDRGTVALDQLVQVADMIFTGNGQPVQDYLHRMIYADADTELPVLKKRQEEEHQPSPPPALLSLSLSLHHLPTETENEAEEDEMNTYASALGPSMFFTRRYNQVGKQVVVTQGSRGAMHIVCNSIVETHINGNKHCCATTRMPAINKLEMIIASQQQEYNHGKRNLIRRLQHTFSSSSSRHSSSSAEVTTTVVATYSVQSTGVLQNIKNVVDTTGAGDAFMGGFLLFRIALQQLQQQQHQLHDNDKKQDEATVLLQQEQQQQNCLLLHVLDFGSWVAGHKVQGPGARMALPTARDMDKALGTSLSEIQESLGQLVGPFQFYR